MSDKKPLTPDVIFHIEDDDDLLSSVAKTVRRAGVIAGIVELVLGVVMLFWPSKTLTAVTVLLGIGFLVYAYTRKLPARAVHPEHGGPKAKQATHFAHSTAK